MSQSKKPPLAPPPPEPTSVWDQIPLDDPAELNRLLKMLPRVRNKEAFQREVFELTLRLNAGLYERRRYNPRAVHSALEDLYQKLTSALEALNGLGYDASNSLQARAKIKETRSKASRGQTIWQRLEGDARQASGSERVDLLAQALADAADWAFRAAASIDFPGIVVDPPNPEVPGSRPTRRGGGRPPDHLGGAAIGGLVYIWEEQTGERPTIITGEIGPKRGPFLDFCKAVIAPIYKARGVKMPSVASLAHAALYLPRPKSDGSES